MEITKAELQASTGDERRFTTAHFYKKNGVIKEGIKSCSFDEMVRRMDLARELIAANELVRGVRKPSPQAASAYMERHFA